MDTSITGPLLKHVDCRFVLQIHTTHESILFILYK